MLEKVKMFYEEHKKTVFIVAGIAGAVYFGWKWMKKSKANNLIRRV